MHFSSQINRAALCPMSTLHRQCILTEWTNDTFCCLQQEKKWTAETTQSNGAHRASKPNRAFLIFCISFATFFICSRHTESARCCFCCFFRWSSFWISQECFFVCGMRLSSLFISSLCIRCTFAVAQKKSIRAYDDFALSQWPSPSPTKPHINEMYTENWTEAWTMDGWWWRITHSQTRYTIVFFKKRTKSRISNRPFRKEIVGKSQRARESCAFFPCLHGTLWNANKLTWSKSSGKDKQTLLQCNERRKKCACFVCT